MAKKERQFYEFGSFRIDPDHRLLLRENQPIPVQPKAFDILLTLVQNSEKVVLKDDLMKAVWPETFVEEANLAQQVFVLRKTLGDAVGENRYIVTVPGRGYRFVGKVTEVDVPEPAESGLAQEGTLADQEEDLIVESHTRTRVLVEGKEATETAEKNL